MPNTSYTDEKINDKLSAYPGWHLGDDGQLYADFTFADFSHAILFANTVGHLAESLDHHPDILIHGYKHVRVSVMSHDVGGITARDFKLINQIAAVPNARPETA